MDRCPPASNALNETRRQFIADHRTKGADGTTIGKDAFCLSLRESGREVRKTLPQDIFRPTIVDFQFSWWIRGETNNTVVEVRVMQLERIRCAIFTVRQCRD